MIFQIVFADMSNIEVESLASAKAAGLVQNGVSKSYADAPDGAAVPRQMLWNQPKFEGFAGPMYGRSYESGEDCLRYEAWKAYEIMSA